MAIATTAVPSDPRKRTVRYVVVMRHRLHTDVRDVIGQRVRYVAAEAYGRAVAKARSNGWYWSVERVSVPA